jgi:hypothetical protein
VNTRDFNPSDKTRILVYGAYGTGKTWGAITAPRPCMMDFDKGIAVVSNPKFITAHGKLEFEYEQFTEKDQQKGIPKRHNAYDDACKYFDKMMGKDWVDTFDTWIIDSGTTLSELAQNKAVILLGGWKYSKTHAEALNTGLMFPKIQDYGSERSLTEQFVQMLLDTDKHLILLAHEMELTTDQGVTTDILPLFTGKSRQAIPLKFDEVYRLTAKKHGPNLVRALTTETDGIVKAKTRYGLPEGTLWNWKALQDAIKAVQAPQPKGSK